MPRLLPPTVGERLARCSNRVYVEGITPGADVELSVNGAIDTKTISGTSTTFELTSTLNTGDIVTARQRLGTDESDWSNEIEVEDVGLPPTPPHVEPSLPRCGRCTLVRGAAPGSTVELLQAGHAIASGEINRHGWACLRIREMPREGQLHFRTITCGTNSPLSGAISVDRGPRSLPPPVIRIPPEVEKPIFGCQKRIPLAGIYPGAVVELFADGAPLGRFCSCWSVVNAYVGRQLRVGERITARQSMAIPEWDCNVVSSESAPVEVVPPDSRIKPIILEPLREGDLRVRVNNQIEGGTITLYVRQSAGAPEEELGSRPSSESPEIPVPGSSPLRAGQVLRAMQELCGVQEFSDPVTVQPSPGHIDPPSVRAPLYACSVVVAVDDVLPGATVYLWQDGIPIGHAWSANTSVVVNVAPSLRQGARVTAYQRAGGLTSVESAPVTVQRRERLPRPSIPPPVRPGDTAVWVTNLVPGAYVRVFDGGLQIGGANVVDSAALISVYWPIDENAIITATQTLCLRTSAPSAPRPATPGVPCEGPPRYEPTLWNDGGLIQDNNNCYNYACNIRTDTFAQPGRASGHGYADVACDAVTNAALGDGLRQCISSSCHPCYHKVALAVKLSGRKDYHWYRQDINRRWSHKPGETPATDTDNSGDPITDPSTANRGAYTEFCGYFCVYRPDVTIT